MSSKNTVQTQTRLLLALWDLGGKQQEVKKGQLTKRIISKGKKISPKGLEVLGDGLRSGDFKFEGTIVGTWAANALVKWISQIDVVVTSAGVPVNGKSAIASYDEFKLVALEVYDKLNQNYNLDDLVPIYRIRKEIGDRVSREDFNEWLLEMQEKDILQLIAGEIPDLTPDKREDSITIPGAGLRSYAKRLS